MVDYKKFRGTGGISTDPRTQRRSTDGEIAARGTGASQGELSDCCSVTRSEFQIEHSSGQFRHGESKEACFMVDSNPGARGLSGGKESAVGVCMIGGIEMKEEKGGFEGWKQGVEPAERLIWVERVWMVGENEVVTRRADADEGGGEKGELFFVHG